MKVLTSADLKCPITGKSAFPSRGRAEKMLKRVNVKATTVYRCNHCRWWHLGRERKGKCPNSA